MGCDKPNLVTFYKENYLFFDKLFSQSGWF